jgi:5-methylcytosine-specific restriction enzyme subunit McrC
MTCFSSNLALDSFSEIYKIDLDKPQVLAPALNSIVSPLIIVHFLSVINRIKSLKKGYVHQQENLKKVKGHIKILKNERLNIAIKRYERIFCEYDEYSIDIPENRLLKKALLFSQALVNRMSHSHRSYPRIKLLIAKALKKFENVSDDVEMKAVGQLRSHKLFSEYSEAIRLAKVILKHFDYSINKVGTTDNKVTPFILDMSLLYEHYVYGLLYEAYQEKITYQFKGNTGYPDFLYTSGTFKAILDSKYIPKYERHSLDTYAIRQLSGYSRDLSILKRLGYKNIEESSLIPSIPCVIIYPSETKGNHNPFMNISLEKLCTKPLRGLSLFYKFEVPVPTL